MELSGAETQRLVKKRGATNLERLELAANVELAQSCVELAGDAELES